MLSYQARDPVEVVVMDLESFVHLRTQIWESLREEKADRTAKSR